MNYPKELAGLRGLAAIYILFRHSLAVLPQSYIGAITDKHYGVDLFMIISGFSIYWLIENNNPTYILFIMGRVFRIFPVYIVGISIYVFTLNFARLTLSDVPSSPNNIYWLTLIISAQEQLGIHLVVHATLLQGLVPESVLPHAAYTLIGPAWSLSVEWQLYLVAPLLAGWFSTLDRWNSQACLFGFVVSLLCCGPFLGAGFLGNNLTMFSIGFVSYAILRRLPKDRNNSALSTQMGVMLCLAAIWNASILPTFMVWVAVIYSAEAHQKGRFANAISRGLCSRLSQYLGRISYSFYIFHIIALFMCLRVIDRSGASTNVRYILLPLTSLAVTIIFAELAFRIVEAPVHSLGKILFAPPATPKTRSSAETAAT